jgi:penicillin amidase
LGFPAGCTQPDGQNNCADHDKILAVLPGGVAGRQFDPHTTDQVQSFMDGNKVYWWFSDKAIKEHTKHTLTLSPN